MYQDPTTTLASGPTVFFFNEARKWFTLTSFVIPPVLMVINAPFGRFSLKDQSNKLLFDGIKSWMIMELVSPIVFIYTFVTSPLTAQTPGLPSWDEPHAILAICFLVHYANRAIISPLRTPSRSKSHIIVPFCGIVFNLINGALMGSNLSSPHTRLLMKSRSPTSFYVGLGLWAAGFIGNITHDEILLNIRRKARAKGKAKAGAEKGEHYAIPEGLLYNLISYPNYLCEWVEWLGFAVAASPFPGNLNGPSVWPFLTSLLNPQTYVIIFTQPGSAFAPNLSPPWIFLLSEVLLMLPRAYRGHQWYLNKFKDSYPKNRKAVIPFVL